MKPNHKIIVIKFFLNNFICNFFIRMLAAEAKIYSKCNPYLDFKPNQSKSMQENAGYSNRLEINEVIEKSKFDLHNTIKEFCVKESKVLDIGCGPGMYLQLFQNEQYQLYGTDINILMLNEAKKNAPKAHVIHGDFSKLNFQLKFNFIYCIGVLIYVPTSGIKNFFQKIYDSLEPNGILYLNYPQAISWLDVIYNDLTYINYSPGVIEKLIEPYFKIIKHEQAFDGRKIEVYDKTPYKSLNPLTKRTYKNSYLLIAQKNT